MLQSMTTSSFGCAASIAGFALLAFGFAFGAIPVAIFQLLLLHLTAREALPDQVRYQYHQNQDQRGCPSQFNLVGKGHAGEVVDQHSQGSGWLHHIGAPVRNQPVVAEKSREQQGGCFARSTPYS